MQWLPVVDKLIIELLSNHTPPTCIQSNILATARVLCPNIDIIKELPSFRYIRYMRTVLTRTTKTLAAY